MKFIFADSLDFVDPGYDFLTDRSSPGRQPYWDDRYPHELLNPSPYDGVLISRGIVGDHRFPGRYTAAQAMRLRRVGARRFLRLEAPRFRDMQIFGDSGAFSYAQEKVPPYTPAEVLEFYADAGFTHGCAVDHIIFDFDAEEKRRCKGSEEARSRFDITLENARKFLKLAGDIGRGFTPIGVAQGWSPSSLAQSALNLERMGYNYIALGGMVPLKASNIHLCLEQVRDRIKPKTRLHLLGFAKAEQIDEFVKYRIASFDSTSPLLRSFKDARANYYAPTSRGLDYYSAVRIPQALDNSRLLRAVKEGRLGQEQLVLLEQQALAAVRGYALGSVSLAIAVEHVVEYGSLLADDPTPNSSSREKLATEIRAATARTLRDRPWTNCPCEICRAAGVEVVIFRSSNRNKRRGFHNLGVFFQHVQRLMGRELSSEPFDLPRRARATKR